MRREDVTESLTILKFYHISSYASILSKILQKKLHITQRVQQLALFKHKITKKV